MTEISQPSPPPDNATKRKDSSQTPHMTNIPQPPHSSQLEHTTLTDSENSTSIVHRYSVVQRKTIDDISFEHMPNGLVPVVAQDELSHTVLMVAYCNRMALLQTLQTGYAHYFSRSRNQLWKKGESSGNIQPVQRVLVDCDNDTILYIVRQHGDGACHTGRPNCFFSSISIQ